MTLEVQLSSIAIVAEGYLYLQLRWIVWEGIIGLKSGLDSPRP